MSDSDQDGPQQGADPGNEGDADAWAFEQFRALRDERAKTTLARRRAKQQAHAAWRRALVARRRQQRYWRGGAGVAASVVLAVLVFWFVDQPSELPATDATALLYLNEGDVVIERHAKRTMANEIGPGDTLATGADGRAGLSMGSSSLRIAGDSQIVLGQDGEIRLQYGKIYVRADEHRFTVKTPFGSVQDVGTQFVVSVATATGTLSAAVREGVIRVAPAGHQPVIARAGPEGGRMVVAPAVGRPVVSEIPKTHPVFGWTSALAAPYPAGQSTVRALLQWSANESGRALRYRNYAVERASETALNIARPVVAERMDAAIAELIQTTKLRASFGPSVIHVDFFREDAP